MYLKYVSSLGLPHSSYSGTVRGSDRVEHGVHHVDEGDVGEDGAEEIGAHVGDRAHQQAAGRAAFDGDARGIAVAGRGQVLDARR